MFSSISPLSKLFFVGDFDEAEIPLLPNGHREGIMAREVAQGDDDNTGGAEKGLGLPTVLLVSANRCSTVSSLFSRPVATGRWPLPSSSASRSPIVKPWSSLSESSSSSAAKGLILDFSA